MANTSFIQHSNIYLEFKNAYPGKCAHREIHACHVPGTIDTKVNKAVRFSAQSQRAGY